MVNCNTTPDDENCPMSLVKSPTVWVLALLGAGFIGTVIVLAITNRSFRTRLHNLVRSISRLRFRPRSNAAGPPPPPEDDLGSRPYSPGHEDAREGPPPYDAIQLPAYYSGDGNPNIVNGERSDTAAARVEEENGRVLRPRNLQ
ncbi:MAG: hypothetical protein Q9208_003544 [Pyrenodesmia sp. 3 TL-2023]